MKVNVQNLPTSSQNIRYNQDIGVLVDEIFDGNSKNTKINYIVSNDKNYYDENNRTLYNISQILNQDNNNPQRALATNEDKSILGNDFLKDDIAKGPLELGLINCLLSNYKVIIVTGALGSGKTELVNYVCEMLREHKQHQKCRKYNCCSLKNDKQIIIDFNTFSIVGSTESEIKQQFYRELFQELSKHCAILMMEQAQLLDMFINTTKKRTIKYYSTLVPEMRKENSNWESLSIDNKLNDILIWIRNRFETKNEEDGSYALLELCKFYYNSLPRQDQTCLLLVYDNIDGLDEFAQNIIIEQINRISVCVPFKSIVTSRLMTFNYMKGNASFSFKIYQNMGPSPIEIIQKRIENYLNNKESRNYKNIRANIDTTFLNSFDNRLNHIYTLLLNPESRLYKTLAALAGLSIRRGLRLVRRLFLTKTISWHETSPKEDILTRCLYSYCNESRMMSIGDNRISNIFVDKTTGKFSLINLRILKITNEMRARDITLSVGNLRDHLCLFNNIHNDTILDNIRYLTETRKRLIFLLDYKSLNCELSKLLTAKIIITIAGREYLNYLSSDLQYIQSCFESIEWTFSSRNDINNTLSYLGKIYDNQHHITLLKDFIKSNTSSIIIPQSIDYSNFLDRLSFIRQALKIIVCKDIIESVNYKNKINNLDQDLVDIVGINNLVTIPIVVRVANAVFNITSRRMNDIIRDELINWYDLLVIINEWNNTLFNGNGEMSTILQKYKTICDKIDN